MTQPGGSPQVLSIVGKLSLVTMLGAAAGLVTAPIQARVLGPVGRGELAAVVAPLAILAALGDFGLLTYAARQAARRQPVAALLGSVGLLLVLSGLVTAFIALPLVPLISPQGSGVYRWLLVGLFLLPFVLLTTLLVDLAAGLQRWSDFLRARLILALGAPVALVALFAFDMLTVRSATIVYVIVPLLVCLPVLRVGRSAGRPMVRASVMREAIPFGLRAWVTNAANASNQRLDQAFMAALVPHQELGMYAVAVAVAGVPTVMYTALGRIILVKVAAGRPDAAPRMLRVVLLVLAAVSAVLALALAPLISLVFGTEFGPAVPMAQILLLAGIPLAGVFLLATSLTASGIPGAAVRGELLALATTVTGLALFVPRGGGLAAAWVSLVAYSLSFVVLLHRSSRHSGLSVRRYLVIHRHDITWLNQQVRSVMHSRRAR